LLEFYGPSSERTLNQLNAQPNSQEWVGLYIILEDDMHEWVV